MKMNKEAYQILDKKINELVSLHGGIDSVEKKFESYIAVMTKIKNKDVAFGWALFYVARRNINNDMFHTELKTLNDDHIYTALKKIVKGMRSKKV